jgi:hypothetical protein
MGRVFMLRELINVFLQTPNSCMSKEMSKKFFLVMLIFYYVFHLQVQFTKKFSRGQFLVNFYKLCINKSERKSM